MKNKYYQLVDDLSSGELTLSIVCLAICQHVRKNDKIPDGIKDLLAGYEGSGYISKHFRVLADVIGMVEIAYRRGSQAGSEGNEK